MSRLPFFIALAGLLMSLAGAFSAQVPIGNDDSYLAVYDPPPVLTERNRILPG